MSDFTLNKEEHINCIINKFNFKKVHKVMKFMNWTWYNTGSEPPTVAHLKDEARRLLNELYDSDDSLLSMSTGGLKVSKYEDHLELEFVIAEYGSESLNYGSRYEKMKLAKNRNRKLSKIEKLNYESN